MASFLLYSLVFLFDSGVFHLSASHPLEDFGVKAKVSSCSFIASFISCKAALSSGERCSLSQSSCNVSGCNRNGPLSAPALHRFEECCKSGHSPLSEHREDQFALYYRTTSEKHDGDAKSASDFYAYCAFDASFQGSNDDALSHVAPTAPVTFAFLVFFLLVFIVESRQPSYSVGKSEFRKLTIFPFEGDRLLVVAFVVAVVFTSSTHAVEFSPSFCNECNHGWICYFSSCLKVSIQSLSWSEAAEMCSEQEAHLWSIDKEDVALRDYLDYHYRHRAFFVGLVSSPITRSAYSYRWSDESPFVYSNWELLNARCEDDLCTTIVPNRKITGSIINWISVACSSPNAFICEKPKRLTADVRLVDGVTSNRGRLEIFLDGVWGRVCMAKSGVDVSQTAFAVCRHLGYPDVFFARALNFSGEGNKANTSFFVDCMWNENAISCLYERATCDLDLFVSCQSSRTHSVGLRLVNGSLPSEGILQFLVAGIWKETCTSNLADYFVNSSCKYLGYAKGILSRAYLEKVFKSFFFPSCFGNPPLPKCYFAEIYCLSSFAIKCFNSEWQVRLVNTADKTHETEGNVEVFLNETWTSICSNDDNKWELTGANVVCRQLGFTKAVLAYSERLQLTPRSLNQSHSFLTVACDGSESSLRHCEHMLARNKSCRNAVAVCKKNEYCPSGWLLYADYCYVISKESWYMDETGFEEGFCGPTNSASISSPHEQAFVFSLLSDYPWEKDVWIGLRREDYGAFEWINEEPLRYVLWATEEPKTIFKCVVMDVRTGYWKTADCSDTRRVLCKISLRDIENRFRQKSAPSQDDRCRKDELYFKSACYYMSKDGNEPVSQDVAQNEKCSSRDAALVSISTVRENAFVAKETSPVQGSLYWTGLVYNDSSAQKAFTWLDTSPVIFTKWGKYEPAYPKGINQRCVLFGSDGHEFVWSVSNCSARAQYVCKRFLNESSNVLAWWLFETFVPNSYVYSCPNGWTELGIRSCFKRVSDRKTWHDSLMDCEGMGTRSSLARILSIQEQNELSFYLLKEEDEAWIGLNDVSIEGFYVWSDGSPFVYVNWTLFEDDTNSSLQNIQDCVAATKSLWKSDICSKEKASVCFTPATPNFDECSNNADNCHVNATCENTIFSYTCTCKPGFIGNGTNCEDYDECSNDADNCHVNATCENTISSYTCTCKPGFIGNGTYCKDYDECSNNADNCHVNAICENTISSYTCTCKSGFTGNGAKCEDVDECEYLCREENQNCSNTIGSHECGCVRGRTRNGSRCVDINECNICDSHAVCINEPGSYQCECLHGWTRNGKICVDDNECELNNNNSCHLGANCTNYEGGYNCTCREGWIGNGSYCEDVNECEMNDSCHSQAYCTNQNGTYICTCLPGWSGNGTSCSDTDECQQSEICHHLADCTNTNGSYECECRRGYAGNGTYCEVSAAQSSSQLKIVISVACSFTFVAFVFIGIVVYARRNNGFGSDFAEPSDEWEVNSGDMTLLEKLGGGFFGVVYKAYLYHSPSGRMSMLARKERSSFGDEKSVVACKMLKESHLEEEELLEEIKLMKRIGQHPHIVGLLGCITTSKPFCLIVEYCMNGDLLNYLRKGKIKCADDAEQHSNESVLKGESLSEDDPPTPSPSFSAHNHQWREINEEDSSEVKNVVDDEEGEEKKGEQKFSAREIMSFVWQIASGMEYLSGKGLVHRDLACRNVLVCDNKLLKVSDFGLTRSVYHDGAYRQKTTRRLPLRWMSIEAITQRLFSEQSDVWSFGVVMWEICTLGSFPYPCISSGKLLSHLRTGNRLTCPENCSAQLYKIMSSCWRADPENRPVFSRLTQLLGKMLEAENHSQYIDFDATGSLFSYDTESRYGREESESGDEDWCLDSMTQVMACGEGDEVSYVVGSATSSVAEEIV
ncbi:uncharacterized protein [Oscarella lobularis]|uniref:uncharacterized protein isoform X4 n=1 Tax=Oscarella lobularis TaxID=121494 RepID=UPI00331310BA